MKDRKRVPRAKPPSLPPRTGSRTGGAASYAAYAVAADGSRRPLDAHSLIVDLGGTEVEIDLNSDLPHQLNVSAAGDGLLVVSHGDAGSVHLSVQPFAFLRRKSP
jgi:hypothetical protein